MNCSHCSGQGVLRSADIPVMSPGHEAPCPACGGRGTIIPLLHADHGLDDAHKAFVQEVLADWDGGFTIRVVGLPDHLQDLPSGLYGPEAGDDPVGDDEVVYEVRGNRKGPSRLVDLPPRPVRRMVIVAGPGRDEPVIYTAYGGPMAAPREPWDTSMSPAEKAESEAFWAQHALSR